MLSGYPSNAELLTDFRELSLFSARSSVSREFGRLAASRSLHEREYAVVRVLKRSLFAWDFPVLQPARAFSTGKDLLCVV